MTLKSLYNTFAKHEEGQWIMVWDNARKLYDFVLKHPVTEILDLGTGIGASAAVMALALKDKGVEGHIDSLDQYEKCVKLAGSLIPEELQKYISIHHVPVKAWSDDKMKYMSYSIFESVPEKSYDLIVNDGPAPFLDGESYVDIPNGTITKMLMEERIKPGSFVIWDGRLVALSLLERYFGNNFYLIPPERGSDLNIIERKDNPVEFKDSKLESMRANTTYFKGME